MSGRRASRRGGSGASERALEALLRGAVRASGESLSAWEGPPAQAAMAGLLAAADEELGRYLVRTGARVLPSARRELVALLSQRLMRSCLKVLALELQGQEALGLPGRLDAGARAWRERFSAYPVLAEHMGGTVLRWRAHVRELLSRLAADDVLLGQAFWKGRPPGALAGVEGDAGDLHVGGRSVALLRFEDGRRVVYKPKDLRITREVLELYTLLNGSGLPLPLHVHTVLCRRGYSWEEYVTAEPCRTAAGVERFYLRVGMLVRLMQLLEAQDLWFENLVAHGEHPVLVDLEMVLQPRKERPTPSTAKRAAEDFLHESVMPLGLLAAPVAIAPGVPAEDLGGLTPVRPLLIPRRSDPVRERLVGKRRPSRGGYMLKTHTGHAPVWAGRPGRAVEHLEALLEGYRAMHATLRANRSRLRAGSGPLRRLARQPVRYVHRDTWSCYRILEVLTEPRVLASPDAHEEELGHLLRAVEGQPAARSERAVVRLELEALRALEIPYFTCRPGSDALLGPGGQVVRSRFFEGTALGRLRRRLQDLEAFPLARHESLLRSTLATGRHTAPPPPRLRVRPGTASPDWLAEAVSMGDVLLREAFSEGGGLAWIGLMYEPLHALWHLGVPGPDLLSGSAGVAVALAELAAASGLARFRDAALGALESTRAALQQARGGRWTLASDGTVEVGAFRGIGAQLYTLHRCAVALELPELDAEARGCARTLPVAWLADQAPLALVTGTSGLLLALRACGATGPARKLEGALRRRLERGTTGPLDLRVPARLQGLPSPASALALCGLRAPGEAVAGGRRRGSGSSGSLLARIALASTVGRRHRPPLTELRQWLRRADRDSAHLEALELALTAARELDEPALLHEAVRAGQLLVARHRLHGRWFPERLRADEHDLSALDGFCALLRAFLGIQRPGTWTSLRLVRPAVGT